MAAEFLPPCGARIKCSGKLHASLEALSVIVELEPKRVSLALLLLKAQPTKERQSIRSIAEYTLSRKGTLKFVNLYVVL